MNPADQLKRLLEIAYTTGQVDAVDGDGNMFENWWNDVTGSDVAEGIFSLERIIQERLDEAVPTAEPFKEVALRLHRDSEPVKFVVEQTSSDGRGIQVVLIDSRSYWERHKRSSHVDFF